MTAPPDTDPPIALELPESGSGERAARRRRLVHRRTLRRVGFASAMVVLVAAIPVLATLGYRTLRDTTTGRRIDAQNDPSKPRYEANVLPTPVSLLVEMGADNTLQGLTMVALGRQRHGWRGGLHPARHRRPASRRYGRHLVEHLRHGRSVRARAGDIEPPRAGLRPGDHGGRGPVAAVRGAGRTVVREQSGSRRDP